MSSYHSSFHSSAYNANQFHNFSEEKLGYEAFDTMSTGSAKIIPYQTEGVNPSHVLNGN